MCLNLTSEAFDDDRHEMLIRAKSSGVDYALVCGSNLEDSIHGIELTTKLNMAEPEISQDEGTSKTSASKHQYPILYNTVGFHPHNARQWKHGGKNKGKNKSNDQTSAESLKRIVKDNPKMVKAIGECGLDYNRNYSTKEDQITAFSQQIELAAELQLPLFLHQRDAHEDFIAILKNYSSDLPKMLLHCFTGTPAQLAETLDMGCYLGVTGWICDERRNKDLKEAVKLIPQDKLIIETDAPYLMPRNISKNISRNSSKHSKSKKRNEPSYLPHIASEIAHHLKLDLDELAKRCFANSMRYLAILDN